MRSLTVYDGRRAFLHHFLVCCKAIIRPPAGGLQMRLRLSLSWLRSGAASERGARGIQSHPVQLHIVACAVGGVGCLPLRALMAQCERPRCAAPRVRSVATLRSSGATQSEPRSGGAAGDAAQQRSNLERAPSVRSAQGAKRCELRSSEPLPGTNDKGTRKTRGQTTKKAGTVANATDGGPIIQNFDFA